MIGVPLCRPSGERHGDQFSAMGWVGYPRHGSRLSVRRGAGGGPTEARASKLTQKHPSTHQLRIQTFFDI